MKRLFHIVVLTVGCTVLFGCGRAGEFQGAKVTGTVKLDGKLLAGGSVLMESEDGTRKDASEIRKDGTYAVTNAPLGKIRIALLIPPPATLVAPPVDPKAPTPPADEIAKTDYLSKEAAALLARVPLKYQDTAQSGLTYEVKSGDNTHEISISSK